MSAKWMKTTIGEYCPFVYGKAIKKADQKSDGISVYGSNGVYTYSDNFLVDQHAVIIGRKGSVGKVHLSIDPCWVSDTAFFVKKESLEESYFVYYLLSSLGLEDMNTDAAVPGLNRDNAHRLEVTIPATVDERIALVEPLIKLDQKIALNQKINKTLEQIAQAIFKSWFVDFEPVKAKITVLEAGGSEEEAQLAAMQVISGKSLDELTRFQSEHPEQYAELCATAELFPAAMEKGGEIPEGWMVNQLAQLGDVVCGKTPAKSNPDYFGIGVPFIKIPDMHSSVYVTQPIEQLTVLGAASQPKKMIPPGSVCVSCIATVGKVVLTHEVSQTNQQINSIIPNQPEYSFYLYFQMLEKQQEFLDLASGGSATLNMNTSTFSRVEVLLPSAEIIKLFQRTVMPIFHEILANQKQSDSLTSLRDTILPKLLSGQILLKSAEAM